MLHTHYKRRTGADPYVYSFDLRGYGSQQFQEDKALAFAGFSEKVFKVMRLLESDPRALLKTIEATVLWMKGFGPSGGGKVLFSEFVGKDNRPAKGREKKQPFPFFKTRTRTGMLSACFPVLFHSRALDLYNLAGFFRPPFYAVAEDGAHGDDHRYDGQPRLLKQNDQKSTQYHQVEAQDRLVKA